MISRARRKPVAFQKGSVYPLWPLVTHYVQTLGNLLSLPWITMKWASSSASVPRSTLPQGNKGQPTSQCCEGQAVKTCSSLCFGAGAQAVHVEGHQRAMLCLQLPTFSTTASAPALKSACCLQVGCISFYSERVQLMVAFGLRQAKHFCQRAKAEQQLQPKKLTPFVSIGIFSVIMQLWK